MKGPNEISVSDIAGQIRVEEPESLPQLILAVSPCRCASTVFMRVFSYAGAQAHFQPLKRIFRYYIWGEKKTWTIPRSSPLFLKETLGPHTEAEASFDPLALLLKAGVPSEKIHLLIMGREPFSVWASWKDWWEGSTSPDLFSLSFQTTEAIRRQALAEDISTTTFVYEALRNQDIKLVVKALLSAFRLDFTPHVVGGWRQLPGFASPGSNVVWYDGPPVKHQWGITLPNQGRHLHERVKNADGLVYYTREESLRNLPATERKAIQDTGVTEIYSSWKTACEEDLGIRIR